MLILSIVVPVYNVEKYVLRCLQSITSQMDKRVEVVVVDDGSKDNSALIVGETCRNNKNIHLYHKQNGGLSSARNYGLSKASGRYIYFVDSDDYLMPGTLKTIVNKLEESDAPPCFAFKHLTTEEHRKAKFQKTQNTEIVFDSIKTINYLKHYRNPITNVWKLIVAKDFLLKNNMLFREGVLCEDIEWITKLLLKTDTVIWADIYLYVYNAEREDSIMNMLSVKRICDTDDNIMRAKRMVDAVDETEKRLVLKRLLFREWCMNLAFYSKLSKQEKQSVHINTSFCRDKEVFLFRLFGAVVSLFSIDSVAGQLYLLKQLRKATKRLWASK